jgi:hypothetical protein
LAKLGRNEKMPDEEKKDEKKKESPYVMVDGKKEMADGSGMVKESLVREEPKDG